MEVKGRLTTYPIMDKEAWGYYEKAKNCYWTPNEISLKTDKSDYKFKLTDPMRNLVNFVVGFFSASDGIVNIGIVDVFLKEYDDSLEIKYFYQYQIMMENIHAETYSILVEEYIDNPAEKNRLINAIREIPTIRNIANFMFECIRSDAPMNERLFRMACVEGVLFTGCFCVIYWLQSMGYMPGLAQSNELISRDEALHTYFALFLLSRLERINRATLYAIAEEVVALAVAFMSHAINNDMVGMNINLMTDYIMYSMNVIIILYGEEPLYKVTNPFMFMDQINLKHKTNFFERRVSDYSKPNKSDDNHGSIVEVNYDF